MLRKGCICRFQLEVHASCRVPCLVAGPLACEDASQPDIKTLAKQKLGAAPRVRSYSRDAIKKQISLAVGSYGRADVTFCCECSDNDVADLVQKGRSLLAHKTLYEESVAVNKFYFCSRCQKCIVWHLLYGFSQAPVRVTYLRYFIWLCSGPNFKSLLHLDGMYYYSAVVFIAS